MPLTPSPVYVTVSGSFHRHIEAIQEAVGCFRTLGCTVLSPAEPIITEAIGRFLLVASDRSRSIPLVQQRHFDSIASSHFLWLQCTDGYVGTSAAAEVGYAAAMGIPIVSSVPPLDQTLREFTLAGYSIEQAVREFGKRSVPIPSAFLLDPELAVQRIDSAVSTMRSAAVGKISYEPQSIYRRAHQDLLSILGEPLWRRSLLTSNNSMLSSARSPSSRTSK